MFCEHCGNIIEPNTKYCRMCGAHAVIDQSKPGLTGFSAKINAPSFKSYKNQSKAWSLIFSLILALITVAGFPIYGKISGEIDYPNSLYYGFGIGGMFILIAVIQTLKRGFDKTWDGVVSYKKSYKRQVRDNNNDSAPVRHEYVYIIKVKKNSGGTKKHKFINLSGIYDYYNKGDIVRHHKGFTYYEKYDKSKDTTILCAACLTFNDINNEFCERCKCPLLK